MTECSGPKKTAHLLRHTPGHYHSRVRNRKVMIGQSAYACLVYGDHAVVGRSEPHQQGTDTQSMSAGNGTYLSARGYRHAILDPPLL
jgi:hypothetical protein